MWLINIIAFFIVTVYIANKSKETMAEVFPVTACGLIFLLYILAYFRCLSWIDGVSIGIILLTIWRSFKATKEDRKIWFYKSKKLMSHPVTIMVIVGATIVSLLVLGRIALWWDDVNFWATDVKSIFFI